jgi:hypothetical protein
MDSRVTLAGGTVFIVFPVSRRPLDVFALGLFRPANEEEDVCFTLFADVDTVAWAMVNPQLEKVFDCFITYIKSISDFEILVMATRIEQLAG